jgi:rhamnosyltransferase
MPEPDVLVSIVVRAFNEEQHLGALLEGIRRQRLDVPWEVVLVDSGSTDRTRQIAADGGCRLVHIRSEDFTFGRSLNLGLEAARGEFAVIVSAHCEPIDENWLANLIEPFDDERVALVYGKQRGKETTKYSEHQIFESWFPEANIDDYEVAFCNNANSAIRRTIWQQLPFDESLSGLEDLDWAKRVKERDFHIYYRADAGVYHIHDETRQQTYRRYFREALAFREIYPNEVFRFRDFLKYFALNTSSDALHALRDGMLLQSSFSIPSFRLMQFWATYKAHSRGSISKEMRRQLFYPPRPPGLAKPKAPRERVPVEPTAQMLPAKAALEITDISRPLSASIAVWPGARAFSLEWKKRYEPEGVNESHLSFNLHTGTHLDAPYHFSRDGKRLGELPLSTFVGTAHVLHYRGDGPIGVDFLEGAFLPDDCARILLRTRNSENDWSGDFDESFVALSGEAASWLSQRSLELVGIDGPSVQPFHDPDNRVHEILLGAGISLLEGLDLGNVAPGVHQLTALPLSIPEAEGAPVRAILTREVDS